MTGFTAQRGGCVRHGSLYSSVSVYNRVLCTEEWPCTTGFTVQQGGFV